MDKVAADCLRQGQGALMRSRNTFLPLKQRRRLNAPPKNEPWSWMTRELLASDAFRLLSNAARQVLFRIIIEHLNHAGFENGRLKVTHLDFGAYGCRYPSIKGAINELVAAGLVDVAREGRRCHGEDHGAPAEYRLTWLPTGTEMDFRPATNRWKSPKPKRARKIIFSSNENVTVSSNENVSRARVKQAKPRLVFSSNENVSTSKIMHGGHEQRGSGHRRMEHAAKLGNGNGHGPPPPPKWHKPMIVELSPEEAAAARERLKDVPAWHAEGRK
jgi:hypothetical protein